MKNEIPPTLPPQSNSLISKLISEEQDPNQVQQVLAKVQQILTSGEEIVYIAVQKPLLNLSPDSVILTNKRFIMYKPGVLGTVRFEDYIWRDLHDAKLSEGIITSTLSLQSPKGLLSLGNLPKAQARKLYAFSQDMEEKAREERRIREMEEKRAGASGLVINGGIPTVPSQTITSSVQEDPMQKLKKLKEMAECGLITTEEYEAKKTEILSKI